MKRNRETRKPLVYVIGSLRNPAVPAIANRIEAAGFEVFADWFAAGKIADDSWQEYETARGKTYAQALDSYAAQNVFDFDLRHLTKADAVVLALPAGKSGHLEFGWARGQSKPGYILFDAVPPRWDVMVKFASGVDFSLEALVSRMTEELLG